MDVALILQSALNLHQAGRLDEVKSLYERVLEAVPEHADALNFLGMLSHQEGDPASAVRLIERAVAGNPKFPFYHNNLGEACCRRRCWNSITLIWSMTVNRAAGGSSTTAAWTGIRAVWISTNMPARY